MVEAKQVYYFMTRSTLKKLVVLLSQTHDRSLETGKQMGEAGGTSDFHDNFAFEQGQRDFSYLMGQVARMRDKIKNAVIIEPNTDTQSIGIGHEVTVRSMPTTETNVYTILGPSDSEPSIGWISCLTPVAQALMGRTTGDIVSLPTEEGFEENSILGFRPGNF